MKPTHNLLSSWHEEVAHSLKEAAIMVTPEQKIVQGMVLAA
jgi:hypothetical protein